jgi:hypothetical protein
MPVDDTILWTEQCTMKALLNAVIDFRLHKWRKLFLQAERLSVS